MIHSMSDHHRWHPWNLTRPLAEPRLGTRNCILTVMRRYHYKIATTTSFWDAHQMWGGTVATRTISDDPRSTPQMAHPGTQPHLHAPGTPRLLSACPPAFSTRSHLSPATSSSSMTLSNIPDWKKNVKQLLIETYDFVANFPRQRPSSGPLKPTTRSWPKP